MISASRSQPVGDKLIGYPQLCIRTNRTAQRTEMAPIVNMAYEIGKKYPMSQSKKIIEEVMAALAKKFGSGEFGHTWIIFFNSDKEGDYTSYAFHNNYGFVKDSQYSSTNDRATRDFCHQACVKINNGYITPKMLESTIIPELNKQSSDFAKMLGMDVKDASKGVYTPVHNCAWFASNVWNYATKLVYEQNIDFDIDYYADSWGMPFLKSFHSISDPGMVAESLKKME